MSDSCTYITGILQNFPKIPSVNKYIQSPKSGGRFFKNKETKQFQDTVREQLFALSLNIPPPENKCYMSLGLMFGITHRFFLRRDASNMIKNVEDVLIKDFLQRNDAYVHYLDVTKVRLAKEAQYEWIRFFIGFHPINMCGGYTCQINGLPFQSWKNAFILHNEM